MMMDSSIKLAKLLTKLTLSYFMLASNGFDDQNFVLACS